LGGPSGLSIGIGITICDLKTFTIPHNGARP
jgi:hypothetical protein